MSFRIVGKRQQKLSAGIELDHYRDIFRQLLLKAFKSKDSIREILGKYKANGRAGLGDEEWHYLRQQLENKSSSVFQIYHTIKEIRDGEADEKQIQEVEAFLQSKGILLRDIGAQIESGFLKLGINPCWTASFCLL